MATVVPLATKCVAVTRTPLERWTHHMHPPHALTMAISSLFFWDPYLFGTESWRTWSAGGTTTFKETHLLSRVYSKAMRENRRREDGIRQIESA